MSLILTALSVSMLSEPALAEPYLALREGYTCAQCHVNHTGGGMRTEFGNIYSQTALPAWPVQPGDDAERGSAVDLRLSDSVAVGGNFRLNHTTVMATESTYLNPASGNERVTGSIDTQHQFSVPEGNLYVRAELVPDHVAVYLDQVLTPGFDIREAFAIAEALPGGTYVKAGKLLQPFGMRILDDDASTRVVTQYRYDTPQLGVEAGVDTERVQAAIAVTNSGGGALGKKFVGNAAVVFRPVRFGVSAAHTDEATGEKAISKEAFGVYGGLGVGRLVVLGEIDTVIDIGGKDAGTQLVSLIEADVLLVQGLNLKIAGDTHDRDVANPEDHRSRLVAGLEFFPVQFLQTSLFYQARFDVPQAAAAAKADRLTLQLHGFF